MRKHIKKAKPEVAEKGGITPKNQWDEEPVDEQKKDVEVKDDDLDNPRPLTLGFGIPSPPWYSSEVKENSNPIVVAVEEPTESNNSKLG